MAGKEARATAKWKGRDPFLDDHMPYRSAESVRRGLSASESAFWIDGTMLALNAISPLGPEEERRTGGATRTTTARTLFQPDSTCIGTNRI
jgi:hypothetical protein